VARVETGVWASILARVRASITTRIFAGVFAPIAASVFARIAPGVDSGIGARITPSVLTGIVPGIWASVEARVGARIRSGIDSSVWPSVVRRPAVDDRVPAVGQRAALRVGASKQRQREERRYRPSKADQHRPRTRSPHGREVLLHLGRNAKPERLRG